MRHFVAATLLSAGLGLPHAALCSDICKVNGNSTFLDPSSVTMASTSRLFNSDDTVSLYECRYTSGPIVCYFNYVRGAPRSSGYSIPTNFLDAITLHDNLLISHKAISATYCNGRDEAVDTVNLAQGDKVWIVVAFDDGAPDITSVRISFPNLYNQSVDLLAPLIKTQ